MQHAKHRDRTHKKTRIGTVVPAPLGIEPNTVDVIIPSSQIYAEAFNLKALPLTRYLHTEV